MSDPFVVKLTNGDSYRVSYRRDCLACRSGEAYHSLNALRGYHPEAVAVEEENPHADTKANQ